MIPIIIISCLGIALYSHTFHYPFQYDDKIYIIDNTAIRNIHDLSDIWKYCPSRFITFLSIAFNYHFHQLNVFGYHLFNLAVHLSNAILVWWLVLLTLSTPVMKQDKISRHAPSVALWAGLVFISHPVQTEAVTYIWQRTASLACLFYLTSLCLYVTSRLLQPGKPKKIYYIFSLIAAVAAMLTKETSVSLPLMVLLYEYYFFRTGKDIQWRSILPFLPTMLIIPLTMLINASMHIPLRGTAPEIPSDIPSTHYFFTQLRVIITYIRLSFLPLNQNLDYDYPVYKSIFEIPVLLSLMALTIILYYAKLLFAKYRLVSFAIFWFFLTLLPESSILPLQDVIFEHRLYLPMAGFSIFLAAGMYYLLGKNNLKTALKVMVLFIVSYSILTYQRNLVWKDEFTLWDDAVHKSPHKERTYNNRGLALAKQGNYTQAISDYTKAIAINPHYINGYVNRALIYFNHGDLPAALSDYSKAIEINPKLAEAYNNRGDIFFERGDLPRAISDYNKSISLKPGNADALYNLGFAYYKQGLWDMALLNFNKVIEINPRDMEVYYNRAVCFYRLSEFDKAWADVKILERSGYTDNPQFIRLLQQATGRKN